MSIRKLDQPINFDNWTERASAAGKLNTNPAGKTNMQRYEDAKSEIAELEAKDKRVATQEKKLAGLKADLPDLERMKGILYLSQTAKTHLQEVYWSKRSGHKRDIHSMYMENGKAGEPEAIRLISELDDPDLYEMGTQLYTKCELPRQRNNHFEGECDIKHSPTVQDTKCSWDIFTFYPHVNELVFSKEVDENGLNRTKWQYDEEKNEWYLPADNIENNDYECQGIVYLELYGEEIFKLRYVLVNMPDEILAQNLRWILRDYGGNEENPKYQDAAMEFTRKHRFDDLPLNTRVCTFVIKRNQSKYLELCRRVEMAREYLNWYSKEMFYVENPGMRPKNAASILKSKIIQDIDLWKKSVEEEKQHTKEVTNKFVDKINSSFEKLVEVSADIIGDGIIEPEQVMDSHFLEVGEEVIVDAEYEDDLVTHDMVENRKLIESIINCKSISELEKLFGDFKGEKTLEIIQEFSNRDKELKIEEQKNKQKQEFKEHVISETVSYIYIYAQNENGSITIDAVSVKADDPLIIKINALKNIEDAVAFYMENADDIDDKEPYESLFFKKKEELSAPPPLEAPKVNKPKPAADKPKLPDVVPAKTYTGLETYQISDGHQPITDALGFEEAKKAILSYLEIKFQSWKNYNEHRDGMVTFFMANREVIERDLSFKEVVANMSKKECERLIDEKKKEMLALVNKM